MKINKQNRQLLKLTMLITATVVLIMSCKKSTPYHHQPIQDPNPPATIPLKEIVIPDLPSPYYHFEYDAAGKPIVMAFADGLMHNRIIYDAAGRIIEMINLGSANRDTLRYQYNNSGKVIAINYTDINGRVYVKVHFDYEGDKLVELVRERILGAAGFVVNKVMRFYYYPDGNLKEVVDQRPALNGQPEGFTSTRFEQYDDKLNVDDFMLLHNDFFDDLWILPGLKLQKNNAQREILSGPNSYTVDYTYSYNDKDYPLLRKGNLLITSGNNLGQRFHITAAYSYY